MKQKERKSTISWILEFAGTKKWFYIFSVLTSIVGVGFSILPYLVMTKSVVGTVLLPCTCVLWHGKL